MREKIKDIDRLMHILEAIGYIQQFMQGKTMDHLREDKLLFFGVVKNIEIIGEAANMLTNEFRSERTEVSWQEIIDMRHVLVHGYYTVSSQFIWDTYCNDLPTLRQQVQQYLDELSSAEV